MNKDRNKRRAVHPAKGNKAKAAVHRVKAKTIVHRVKAVKAKATVLREDKANQAVKAIVHSVKEVKAAIVRANPLLLAAAVIVRVKGSRKALLAAAEARQAAVVKAAQAVAVKAGHLLRVQQARLKAKAADSIRADRPQVAAVVRMIGTRATKTAETTARNDSKMDVLAIRATTTIAAAKVAAANSSSLNLLARRLTTHRRRLLSAAR